ASAPGYKRHSDEATQFPQNGRGRPSILTAPRIYSRIPSTCQSSTCYVPTCGTDRAVVLLVSQYLLFQTSDGIKSPRAQYQLCDTAFLKFPDLAMVRNCRRSPPTLLHSGSPLRP